jgi:hypothetical protein
VVATKLPQEVLEEMRKTEVVSLEQVRLRCEAGLYLEAGAVERDIRRVISWNQIYRASSLKTF